MFENHSALIYPPTVPCCLFCSPLCLTVSSFFFLITFFLLYSLPLLLLFSSTPPFLSSSASTILFPAACQLLSPALIVNRLLSQGKDLQESKMSGHGRSSQWHNTQRTVCGHAKINLTSIHHLTLSVWGFGDTLAV